MENWYDIKSLLDNKERLQYLLGYKTANSEGFKNTVKFLEHSINVIGAKETAIHKTSDNKYGYRDKRRKEGIKDVYQVKKGNMGFKGLWVLVK